MPNIKNLEKHFKIFLVTSVLFSGRLSAQTANSNQVSELRLLAYEKSGEWLYESLPKINIPNLRPLAEDQRPIHLPVDWKKQAAANTEGFPLFKPSAVEYSYNSMTATAYLSGFQTKYYSGGSKLFDDYFAYVQSTKLLTEKQKKIILDFQALIRDRSMLFYLSYKNGGIQLVYYPGKIRFKGGARSQMKSWLPGTPEEIKNGKRSDYALIQDSQGLLAIFNATFDKVDNFLKWKEHGDMQYGGFGYDFNILMEPQPEMATLALYDDGRAVIGAYKNLQNKEKIRTFIQNRYMVIENGELAKDSNPNAFSSFYDNIARSYLFIDKTGRVGYLWSMYTPTIVTAKIALRMGIKDMIILDIHAPISCAISDSDNPLQYSSYKDYMNHSHDFVPNFFRLSPLKATLTWISKAINSRIQNHYIMEAFKGGTEAYFAVFLKNSPEACRISKSDTISSKKKIR